MWVHYSWQLGRTGKTSDVTLVVVHVPWTWRKRVFSLFLVTLDPQTVAAIVPD